MRMMKCAVTDSALLVRGQFGTHLSRHTPDPAGDFSRVLFLGVFPDDSATYRTLAKENGGMFEMFTSQVQVDKVRIHFK